MPKFWDTQKESVIDLEQMEILLFLGVPIPRHFTVYFVLKRNKLNIERTAMFTAVENCTPSFNRIYEKEKFNFGLKGYCTVSSFFPKLFLINRSL